MAERDRTNAETWLSNQRAKDLAARCVGLEAVDVFAVADELAAGATPAAAAQSLLQHGADQASAQEIVQVLRALRDGRDARQ